MCAMSLCEQALWTFDNMSVRKYNICVSRFKLFVCRVGQNRIYTPYMTVHMVNSLPKIPYTHRIYMVLANPICL
jgi:hypothetical protein